MSTKSSRIERTIVVERTYRATLEEVWSLWTTKDGFESWWGPRGFRVEVQELDARVGGALRYDMIAATPEMIDAMKKMGHEPAHKTRSSFAELVPKKRIVLRNVIDFLPGVEPYEADVVVDFSASGDSVRMTVTLQGMHDEQFTKMQKQGFESQLTKLDERYGWTSQDTAS